MSLIRRVDSTHRGKPTHHYERTDTGAKIPGVTTILSDGLPKPALVGWGIKSVAEYAVNNWDDVAALGPADRLKTLKGAPYAERDHAANRGTEVHALAEKLVHGHEVTVPPELRGYVEAYCGFLDDWQPEPVLVEATVYNLAVNFAGTLDLIALMGGQLALADLKTSKRAYGETALQMAAYRYAEAYIDAAGNDQPMPAVEACYVVHVRSDGYEVRELDSGPDTFLAFRYVAKVAALKARIDSLLGEPLTLEGATHD